MSDLCFASLCLTGQGEADTRGVLLRVAQAFSPRYETERDRLVTIDVSGLGRLLGPPRTIGVELVREARERVPPGAAVHVAVAGTCTAARILAQATTGLTVVPPGEEAAALAPLGLDVLRRTNAQFLIPNAQFLTVLSRWGLNTLGELAALPAADLMARIGRQGPVWQALARGEDMRPLVPDLPEERFEASLDLEWPIEGLEPLSFVLTRLLEPLSTRLERRDRAAAALHVALDLVGASSSAEPVVHIRRLRFPAPLREVRALRTLALLDIESHPPAAPIERVAVTIDPTPGRVLQQTLFARAAPTPDAIATLLARLGALMGSDRVGVPATVDSHRPGAFGMAAFSGQASRLRASGLASRLRAPGHGLRAPGDEFPIPHSQFPIPEPLSPGPQSVLRRFRQPVPARVAVESGRPVRVTTDRRGLVEGRVVSSAGPWRSSGHWWSACGQAGAPSAAAALGWRAGWDHEEWDVALADGGVYRIVRDCAGGGWFLEAIVD